MIKSEPNVKAHFHKYSRGYRKTINNINKQLYENIGAELNRTLKGIVLDIGNGGVFVYETAKLRQVIAVDITFDDDMQDHGNIKYTTGDARDLREIESNSCDRVVMQFLLHHIVEENISLTNDSLSSALKEAHRVLKPDGKLVIIEMLVLSPIEHVENALYRVNRRLLCLFDKPMIKFYSKKGLLSKLHSVGFSKIDFKLINFGSKWVEPCPALAPGWFKVPRCLYPAKCYLVIITK